MSSQNLTVTDSPRKRYRLFKKIPPKREDQAEDDKNPALAIPQIRRLISWTRWARSSF